MTTRRAMGLVLLFALFHGPFLVDPPGRDQGVFSLVGRLWFDQGALPYRDAWDHKPPLIYLLHGLAAKTLPGDLAAPALLEGLLALSACLFLACAVGRIWGDGAGLLAGGAYAVLQQAPLWGGFWNRAQPEAFADLPLAVALFVLAGSSSSRWKGLVLGLAGGFLALLKPTLLALLVPLLWYGWRRSRGREGAPTDRALLVFFLLGFLLLPGVCLAYFLGHGAMGDLVDAVWRFNLSHGGVRPEGAGDPLFWLGGFFGGGWILTGVYIAAAVGAVVAFKRGNEHALSPWGLLLGAYVSAAVQGKFWSYHLVVYALPLAVALAVGVSSLAKGHRRASAVAAGLVTFTLLPVMVDAVVYGQRHRILAYWRGSIDRSTFEATYTWRRGSGFKLSGLRQAARMLGERTKPKDPIFLWAFEPLVYLMAHRQPASRFIFHYPLYSLSHGNPLSTRFTAALTRDLDENSPAAILVGEGEPNSLEPMPAVKLIAMQPALIERIQKRYRLEGRTGPFRLYLRR